MYYKNALILDAPTFNTRNKLIEIGYDINNIYIPQFHPNHFKEMITKHPKTYQMSLGNFLNTDLRFSTTWSNSRYNYGIIILHQNFWYKAEPHGNFKLGSKEFWEISKEINSDDDDDVYDPKAQGSRRGPKINVKKSRW